MDWLVDITVRVPPAVTSEELARLTEAERVRGRELVNAGTIHCIWRVPGALRNVGIWCADDATTLHAAISSLPLWRWLEVDVTPLADHPLRAHAQSGAISGCTAEVRPTVVRDTDLI